MMAAVARKAARGGARADQAGRRPVRDAGVADDRRRTSGGRRSEGRGGSPGIARAECPEMHRRRVIVRAGPRNLRRMKIFMA